MIKKSHLIFFILLTSFTSDKKIETLYHCLDPKSIQEHLAFYELYKNTETGKKALNVALELLSPGQKLDLSINEPNFLDSSIIDTIISFVSKNPKIETKSLPDHHSEALSLIGSHLPNRKLKGYLATSEQEVQALKPEEIDLARALFLSQMGNSEESLKKLKNYEAMIDFMALQVLAKLPEKASNALKISTINDLIFNEMGFRFPPHSLYAKDVDVYTFLPSVLDSRRGVCLGVSILYICLAQRLDLPLEMVTPPGHIYIRYKDSDKIINIETTLRGVHLENEKYLSVDTKELQLRNMKEMIGLAHYNQAATFWYSEQYEKAVEAYLKAKPYLENDDELDKLLGFAYLLSGEKTKAEEIFEKVKDLVSPYSVSQDTLVQEYLNGYVGEEGIKAIFKPVDEKRSSILKKKELLEKALVENPKFTSGYFSLAVTWLQLKRTKEALEVLNHYHQMDPENATAEYYLAVLNTERYDYNRAWSHLKQCEDLVKKHFHNPKALKELRNELRDLAPE